MRLCREDADGGQHCREVPAQLSKACDQARENIKQGLGWRKLVAEADRDLETAYGSRSICSRMLADEGLLRITRPQDDPSYWIILCAPIGGFSPCGYH
jgi:hypothetical protein